MADFTLTLELEGRGWLAARMRNEVGEQYTLISFLSDASGELASKTIALLNGASEVRFSWMEEPGEYRGIIHRHRDVAEITVLWFGQAFSKLPDERGERWFQARCSVLRFATQVRGQLRQLLNRHGDEEYRAVWGHRFPEEHLQVLAALLEQRKQAERSGR